MTKDEIINAKLLPYSFEEEPSMFDELYLIPTRRKHDSGYNIIEVVGYNRKTDKLVKLTNMSDVICINNIIFNDNNAELFGISIDINPENRLIRLFPTHGKIFVESRCSTFAINVKEDKRK